MNELSKQPHLLDYLTYQATAGAATDSDRETKSFQNSLRQSSNSSQKRSHSKPKNIPSTSGPSTAQKNKKKPSMDYANTSAGGLRDSMMFPGPQESIQEVDEDDHAAAQHFTLGQKPDTKSRHSRE